MPRRLAIAALLIEYLKRRSTYAFRLTFALRGLLLAGVFFTNSRGAIGGLAVGYGIMETIIHGAHPELGLTRENSLI